MLYFLYGTDTHTSREKLQSLLATLAKKRPDAEVFRLNEDNWNEGQFTELLSSQGLFDQKYIVVFDTVCDTTESGDLIREQAQAMQDSENVFLVLEASSTKKTIDALSSVAEKTQEFTKVEKKKEFFNTFSLGDALGKKDKVGLWSGYLQALYKGVSAEEICGVLFWQIKNIMLAKKTKDAKESKLSPFVDSKARTYAKHFSEAELSRLGDALVQITSRVRNGDGEMEILLEGVILGV